MNETEMKHEGLKRFAALLSEDNPKVETWTTFLLDDPALFCTRWQEQSGETIKIEEARRAPWTTLVGPLMHFFGLTITLERAADLNAFLGAVAALAEKRGIDPLDPSPLDLDPERSIMEWGKSLGQAYSLRKQWLLDISVGNPSYVLALVPQNRGEEIVALARNIGQAVDPLGIGTSAHESRSEQRKANSPANEIPLSKADEKDTGQAIGFSPTPAVDAVDLTALLIQLCELICPGDEEARNWTALLCRDSVSFCRQWNIAKNRTASPLMEPRFLLVNEIALKLGYVGSLAEPNMEVFLDQCIRIARKKGIPMNRDEYASDLDEDAGIGQWREAVNARLRQSGYFLPQLPCGYLEVLHFTILPETATETTPGGCELLASLLKKIADACRKTPAEVKKEADLIVELAQVTEDTPETMKWARLIAGDQDTFARQWKKAGYSDPKGVPRFSMLLTVLGASPLDSDFNCGQFCQAIGQLARKKKIVSSNEQYEHFLALFKDDDRLPVWLQKASAAFAEAGLELVRCDDHQRTSWLIAVPFTESEKAHKDAAELSALMLRGDPLPTEEEERTAREKIKRAAEESTRLAADDAMALLHGWNAHIIQICRSEDLLILSAESPLRRGGSTFHHFFYRLCLPDTHPLRLGAILDIRCTIAACGGFRTRDGEDFFLLCRDTRPRVPTGQCRYFMTIIEGVDGFKNRRVVRLSGDIPADAILDEFDLRTSGKDQFIVLRGKVSSGKPIALRFSRNGHVEPLPGSTAQGIEET